MRDVQQGARAVFPQSGDVITGAAVALSLVCAVVDWRVRRIPYRLTLPLLAFGVWSGGHWVAALITLAVLFGTYLALLWRVGRDRLPYADADAVLGAAFAGLLGWPLAGYALTASGVLAVAVNWRKPPAQAYAYGPYIVGCGLVALLLRYYGG